MHFAANGNALSRSRCQPAWHGAAHARDLDHQINITDLKYVQIYMHLWKHSKQQAGKWKHTRKLRCALYKTLFMAWSRVWTQHCFKLNFSLHILTIFLFYCYIFFRLVNCICLFLYCYLHSWPRHHCVTQMRIILLVDLYWFRRWIAEVIIWGLKS